MTDKLDFMRQELEAAKAEKRYINIRTMDSPADAWMVVDGEKVLNFCTNNYLGLANHPEIKEAAKKAVDEWGVGPGAVRTIAGTQRLHIECERRLAEFKRVEAALLVQSGFCANQAAIPPLVGRDRAIVTPVRRSLNSSSARVTAAPPTKRRCRSLSKTLRSSAVSLESR